MLPEDQKRILGYFIEEAKDHLNTIEQGLLSLQATIEDPDMVNEVFRAAHSVKGGAAMLGIGSMQRTAHRMEDFFKLLKEAPIQTDRELESLLLRIFDGLKDQLEQLQGPFGLTEDQATTIMATLEPVFAETDTHLQQLLKTAPAAVLEPVSAPTPVPVVAAAAPASNPETSALNLVFRSDIPALLRDMLTTFKQADTPTSRQDLAHICQRLHSIGEQFELTHWCDLTHAVRQAVGNPQVTYRTLAPIVIKDLKQAQEQVLRQAPDQITTSTALLEMVPADTVSAAVGDNGALDALLAEALHDDTSGDDLADLFATAEVDDTEPSPSDTDDGWLEQLTQTSQPADDSGLDAMLDSLDGAATAAPGEVGPEVGMAELNSLADLFEGDVGDLADMWEEEPITDDALPDFDLDDDQTDLDSEFADFLGAEPVSGIDETTDTDLDDEMASLFGYDLDDESALPDVTEPADEAVNAADLDDLDSALDLTLEPTHTPKVSLDLEADLDMATDAAPADSPAAPEVDNFFAVDRGDQSVAVPEQTTEDLADFFEAGEDAAGVATASSTEADFWADDAIDSAAAVDDDWDLGLGTEPGQPTSTATDYDLGDWLETADVARGDAGVDAESDSELDSDPFGEFYLDEGGTDDDGALTDSAAADLPPENLTPENLTPEDLAPEDATATFSESPAPDMAADWMTPEPPVAAAEAVPQATDAPEVEFTLDQEQPLDGSSADAAAATAPEEPGMGEPDIQGVDLDTPEPGQADEADLGFEDLEALLDDDAIAAPDPTPEPLPVHTPAPVAPVQQADSSDDDEFGDLEKLLEDADQLGGSAPVLSSRRGSVAAASRRTPRRVSTMADQTMRVSVSHLDTLSNLVGELVVNRNSLEQDQDRLRQFLDNLLAQVSQLNDVGQRMRDLYERSLLESSLMANRQAFALGGTGQSSGSHATGATFDALEMDRFTGFHTLSQEMIELIVRVREASSDIEFTIDSTDQIARQFRQVTTQLQEGLNKARMVPFSQTAERLPRAVRDISVKCGKEARLVVEGRDTLIDKMILERLYDPMTHLVNNAITHGIESPEARAALGKPREGTITVRAFYQGNQTVIYIADDGGGINPTIVKDKALRKGLITPDEVEGMSELEVYDLLFLPGFSTRDQADDFSGRGVGMDVVRTALSEIRGSITIESDVGKGTSFTIRLPLTLSITKALSCVNNQARIAFPMDGVEDMFDVPKERIQIDAQGYASVLWRDMRLPFRPLGDLLQFNRSLGRGRVYGGPQDEDVISMVVLRSASTFVGLQVDQVIGEQEIVIKQLEGPVPKPVGIAGATVLGDGRVMPIADVLELIDIATGRMRREAGVSLWTQPEVEEPAGYSTQSEPTVLIVDDSITVRELLSMSFNKVGYRVEQARDGQEAWEKLRSGLPCDLVFCDIEMPRMDGLELLSRMQKDERLSPIPIAMLTSRGADRHRQMAVDLGAKGYFTKPYLEEMLLDAAKRMLQGENMVSRRGD
ncbi:hybrid sensor histidine kinase/response regulator [Nodosilinea sp. P-1105]|uniref:hybrid sensor histidine kinase/response regulator n=1 Tax=Nodosilinea sp. P-1105 TaxID=2546229 RepID=UPI00146E2B2D|nr:hybrid sensor histidine kinase/response regulator [Nodosilinea sp. P-1105]NMF82058.1 hybrid sensor histidine kinase/response regulator [Nodosilinea sp. P-1105]